MGVLHQNFPHDFPRRTSLPLDGYPESKEHKTKQNNYALLEPIHLMFPLEDVRVFELHTATPDAADKHPKRSKTAPSRDGPDNKDKSTVIIPVVETPTQFRRTKCSNALHTT